MKDEGMRMRMLAAVWRDEPVAPKPPSRQALLGIGEHIFMANIRVERGSVGDLRETGRVELPNEMDCTFEIEACVQIPMSVPVRVEDDRDMASASVPLLLVDTLPMRTVRTAPVLSATRVE